MFVMRTLRILTPVIFLTAMGLFAAGTAVRSDDDVPVEPPLEVILEIEGQRIEAAAGQPFEIDLEGRKLAGVVQIAPTRLLKVHSLSFRYPRHMAWEYDDSDGIPTWGLDGSNTVLLLFDHGEEGDAASASREYEEGLGVLFGDGISARGEAAVSLGATSVKGRRVIIHIGGVAVTQEIYGVRAAGRSFLLVLQDQRENPAQPTPETQELLKLLDTTWKVEPERSQ